MTINGLSPQDLYKSQMAGAAYGKNAAAAKAASAGEPSETGAGDAVRVEISQQGSDVTQARALAQKAGLTAAEPGRAARLEQLRDQVRGGTYSVPASEIARSIVGGRLDKRV